MNDKTKLMVIKIGCLFMSVFYLAFLVTFYVGFFNGGQILVTLNDFGEMYIEAFVYLPISAFVIVFAMVLLSKMKVD